MTDSTPINTLLACCRLAQAGAADSFIKGRAVFYCVYVTMHVKEPQLSIARVVHVVPVTGFCLSLCKLRALERDARMIQSNKQTNKFESFMC